MRIESDRVVATRKSRWLCESSDSSNWERSSESEVVALVQIKHGGCEVRVASENQSGRVGANQKCSCHYESEVVAKLTEALHLQQPAIADFRAKFVALQHPGVVMRDENSVQSCLQSGIDVGLGAIADHPCALA